MLTFLIQTYTTAQHTKWANVNQFLIQTVSVNFSLTNETRTFKFIVIKRVALYTNEYKTYDVLTKDKWDSLSKKNK